MHLFNRLKRDNPACANILLYSTNLVLAYSGVITWSTALMITFLAKPVIDLAKLAIKQDEDSVISIFSLRNVVAVSIPYFFSGTIFPIAFKLFCVNEALKSIEIYDRCKNGSSDDNVLHSSFTNATSVLIETITSKIINPTIDYIANDLNVT